MTATFNQAQRFRDLMFLCISKDNNYMNNFITALNDDERWCINEMMGICFAELLNLQPEDRWSKRRLIDELPEESEEVMYATEDVIMSHLVHTIKADMGAVFVPLKERIFIQWFLDELINAYHKHHNDTPTIMDLFEELFKRSGAIAPPPPLDRELSLASVLQESIGTVVPLQVALGSIMHAATMGQPSICRLPLTVVLLAVVSAFESHTMLGREGSHRDHTKQDPNAKFKSWLGNMQDKQDQDDENKEEPIDPDGSSDDKIKDDSSTRPPEKDDVYVLTLFDKDHDGYLNSKEMSHLFHKAGIPHFPWMRYDLDDDSKLSKKEFSRASVVLKEQASDAFRQSVALAFQQSLSRGSERE